MMRPLDRMTRQVVLFFVMRVRFPSIHVSPCLFSPLVPSPYRSPASPLPCLSLRIDCEIEIFDCIEVACEEMFVCQRVLLALVIFVLSCCLFLAILSSDFFPINLSSVTLPNSIVVSI